MVLAPANNTLEAGAAVGNIPLTRIRSFPRGAQAAAPRHAPTRLAMARAHAPQRIDSALLAENTARLCSAEEQEIHFR